MENDILFRIGKLDLFVERNKCVILYAGRKDHNDSDTIIVYNLLDKQTNKKHKLVITTQIDRSGREIAEILERELTVLTDTYVLNLQPQLAFSGNVILTLDKRDRNDKKEQLFCYTVNSFTTFEDK